MLQSKYFIKTKKEFPALDGGRLLFLGIEKFRGIRVKWENYAHIVGFIILILLMILLTYKDVVRNYF